MDLRMPRLDGIEATRRLREAHPEVSVIALTTFADDESVLGALRAGARGYLTKDASSSDIQAAILTVAAGDAALDPAIQHHVVAALARPIESAPRVGSKSGSRSAPGAAELPDDLTQREAEALALIAEGLTNAEIAERLVVSPTTIKPTSTTCSPRPAYETRSGRQLRLPDGNRHPAALTAAETRASAQPRPRCDGNQAA
jgi:DNA-binding NarL/FixJ family response regulator